MKKHKQPLIDRITMKIADNMFLAAATCLVLPLSLALVILMIISGINYSLGTGGFGPENQVEVTVNRLFVDGGGKSSSHYMVGTDKGVFEVQNFLLPVQVFNSDEIYSQLEVGKTYSVKTKGNKVVNWFFQEYPYIIEVK